MIFFADTVVKPYIAASGYRRVCEIGASFGLTTDRLLELDSVSIDIIDPCLDADLREKYEGHERVRVHKGISLKVLQRLSGPFDCILIDGDHNWYTVYNELRTIEERGLLRPGGTIFFHDVSWPYGRRDMYYQPELIPEEFIHPFRREGIVRGQSELSGASPFNSGLCNAVHEGGPRNGVLTAIEDFLNDRREEYKFFHFEEEHGLGVLLRKGGMSGGITFRKYLLKASYTRLLRRAKRYYHALKSPPGMRIQQT
ncbi:MAG TPA: class I SAM-dependent methyltransferase [Pyrinomonadaceae bacterium]|nr:class I SAM-dependent methyltransferase [Pyrinomonadaceae bacterium]